MRLVLSRYGLVGHAASIEAQLPTGVRMHHATDEADFLAHLPEADAIYGHITEAEFPRAERLSWLQNNATGWDALDFPAMRASNVAITGISGLLANPVAEHGLALLLALSRGLPSIVRQQQERNWKPVYGRELAGLRVCVLGMGAIGRRFCELIRPLGLRIQGVDAYPLPAPEGVEGMHLVAQLDAVLAQSDLLVVCCPRSDETRGLIDAGRFAAMPTGSQLIVLSRGGIVDEPALCAALASGQLASAALDVCAEEPCPPDNPLWNSPNLLLSPHSAGYSQFTMTRKLERFITNLQRWAAGEALLDLLPLSRAAMEPAQ